MALTFNDKAEGCCFFHGNPLSLVLQALLEVLVGALTVVRQMKVLETEALFCIAATKYLQTPKYPHNQSDDMYSL